MSNFTAKMHQTWFRLGFRPRPCWGSLYSPLPHPEPPSWISGPTSDGDGVSLTAIYRTFNLLPFNAILVELNLNSHNNEHLILTTHARHVVKDRTTRKRKQIWATYTNTIVLTNVHNNNILSLLQVYTTLLKFSKPIASRDRVDLHFFTRNSDN